MINALKTRPCSFMADVDGVAKFYDSFAIDRNDVLSQMREIFGDTAIIEIYLLQFKD